MDRKFYLVISIAFHEAQIESNNRSIEHHQGKIDGLKETDDVGNIDELKEIFRKEL